jgi:hypothetical protein
MAALVEMVVAVNHCRVNIGTVASAFGVLARPLRKAAAVSRDLSLNFAGSKALVAKPFMINYSSHLQKVHDFFRLSNGGSSASSKSILRVRMPRPGRPVIVISDSLHKFPTKHPFAYAKVMPRFFRREQFHGERSLDMGLGLQEIQSVQEGGEA